jgi:hypothetical protein
MADYMKIVTIVIWGFVPLILLLILCFTLFRIPDKMAELKIKASARAGKFAGLIVLILFIISQKNRDFNFSFRIPSYEFDLWPTLVGALAGFIVYGVFSFIKPARAMGIFVLAIVSSTSIVLYSYFFISGLSKTVMYGTLGVLLGVLFYEVVLPIFVREGSDESSEGDVGR